MRSLLYALIFLLPVGTGSAQSIGINTNGGAPHPSAILDVSSISKGVLLPRMTPVQRNAIVNPATGLIVFDTGTKSLWLYTGTSWTNTASGGAFSLPYSGSIDTTIAGFSVTNTGPALEGYSSWGSGVNAYSNTGAGLNALSTSGFGIITTSVQNSALYAFNNNINPTINAVNNNFNGFAIQGNAPNYHAIQGTTAGTSKAGIRGQATGLGGYGVYGTTESNSGYGVCGYSLTGTGVYGFSNTNTAVRAVSNSGLALDVSGKVKISGGNTNPSIGAVLTSDALGNATWQAKTGFCTKGIASGQIQVGYQLPRKVEFASESFDYGGIWTQLTGNPWPGSSTLNITTSGVYHLTASVMADYNSDGYEYGRIEIILKRNGTNTILCWQEYPCTEIPDWLPMDISTTEKLLAGDQLWIQVAVDNADGSNSFLAVSQNANYFNGYLVFRD